MFKSFLKPFYGISTGILCGMLFFLSCSGPQQECAPKERDPALKSIDSLADKFKWPEELKITGYVGPEVTPSPACLAVAPTGEVFVGVDMIGSLGKTPGLGKIVKLIDCNNDGVVDSNTVFAELNNPRGIFVVGDKVFVLHTVFSKEKGIATGMDLVLLEDKNHDHVADGPAKPLIQHISNAKSIQDRGTDHATNGIRMGIDGWIYIAVGDFGFHNATDRDGKKLTMLGGGIVRVRPDGTEMEVYSHGLRNIYDVAIDPFMNIFTRGNTNDGGGWNIRFIHQVQTAEYGYPLLFKHFTEETIPALVDLGGGSGVGAIYMDDPTWPEKYNEVPMMGDWGRSQLFIHRVTPVDASFTQKNEDFIRMPQLTDVDVDASGRMYMSVWNGAGYSGDSTKGFVVRVVPKDWEFKAFPDLKDASITELQELLKSAGSVARLHAQRELLNRDADDAAEAALEVAQDKNLPLDVRVAGIFTYAQAAKAEGIENLVKLIEDDKVREFALRALADRKPFVEKVPVAPFVKALNDPSERVQVAAIIGLGRLGQKDVAKELLKVDVPNSFVAPARGTEGPHATPNSDIVPPHVAVKALVALHAVDACVAAIGTDNSTLALWALRYMHDTKAVDGLIAAYQKTGDEVLKYEIIKVLSRIYHKEAPYDASWWWGTRPDTHGPYYKPVDWEGSAKIKTFLLGEWKKADEYGKEFFANLNGKLRLGITQFGGQDEVVIKEETNIDLNKIRNQKGQVGKASIENVLLAMQDIKGDMFTGKKLFVQQGCVACHSVEKGASLKGPFMGQIGSIMSREQIAESILKPNASISQGFASVLITTKDDKSIMGFVTAQSAERVVLRDITGKLHTVKAEDIKERKELGNSMMPAGLANSLSYEEFASLITYLSKQKE